MDFGEALKELRQGKQVARKAWKHNLPRFGGQKLCIGLQTQMQAPDAPVRLVEDANNTGPYLWIDTLVQMVASRGCPNCELIRQRYIWPTSQVDILATDWEVIN